VCGCVCHPQPLDQLREHGAEDSKGAGCSQCTRQAGQWLRRGCFPGGPFLTGGGGGVWPQALPMPATALILYRYICKKCCKASP
jgi:hypothetical protein